MWDPPGPGLEPVSPSLADKFLTTAPPGKWKGSILRSWLKFRGTIFPAVPGYRMPSHGQCQREDAVDLDEQSPKSQAEQKQEGCICLGDS